jgi:hypothetical protein
MTSVPGFAATMRRISRNFHERKILNNFKKLERSRRHQENVWEWLSWIPFFSFLAEMSHTDYNEIWVVDAAALRFAVTRGLQVP